MFCIPSPGGPAKTRDGCCTGAISLSIILPRKIGTPGAETNKIRKKTGKPSPDRIGGFFFDHDIWYTLVGKYDRWYSIKDFHDLTALLPGLGMTLSEGWINSYCRNHTYREK